MKNVDEVFMIGFDHSDDDDKVGVVVGKLDNGELTTIRTAFGKEAIDLYLRLKGVAK